MDGLLPSLHGNLLCLVVNPLVIVVANQIIQYLLGFRSLLDFVFFTEIGKSPLKVIKGLLYLSLGLSLPFPRIDHPDAEATEGLPKLALPLILTKLVSHMNPLMENKPKDGVIIQIIGQRNPLSSDSQPHCLKILKGGLSPYDPCPNDPSGVVIFGENKIVFLFCPWKPEMMGGVMLKQGPRTRSLKPRRDLPFLLR